MKALRNGVSFVTFRLAGVLQNENMNILCLICRGAKLLGFWLLLVGATRSLRAEGELPTEGRVTVIGTGGENLPTEIRAFLPAVARVSKTG